MKVKIVFRFLIPVVISVMLLAFIVVPIVYPRAKFFISSDYVPSSIDQKYSSILERLSGCGPDYWAVRVFNRNSSIVVFLRLTPEAKKCVETALGGDFSAEDSLAKFKYEPVYNTFGKYLKDKRTPTRFFASAVDGFEIKAFLFEREEEIVIYIDPAQ